ncbi:hypothetical protein [Candidatus Ferrigenium straubiae]|jgi:hypothetical protein|uniref:hypothetical protein n=1 Tax=Candidatus Ferrigenium straubiae TaxID=2919506 RepID=UPI003F4A8C58
MFGINSLGAQFSSCHFFLLGVSLAALLFPDIALGDYGEKFLSVRCNPEAGVFEVEPRIIWNGTLDALRSDIEQSNGNVRLGDTLLIQFSLNPPAIQPTGNLEAKCTISRSHLKAIVHGWDFPKLELFSEDEQIANLTIGYVWQFSGYVFRVRYTPTGGWEEFCGGDKKINSWRTLDRKRLDTNCPTH